jgi:hypothetical protein
MQPHGPDCNFFWPQRYDCCWIEDDNVQLVIHTPSTEAGQTYKILPDYCPKLRRNIGVGVLIGQILTASLIIPRYLGLMIFAKKIFT